MSNVKVKMGSQWETLVELPKERKEDAMVAIGWDRIAIVGGYTMESMTFLKSLLVWNVQTKQWSNDEMKEAHLLCSRCCRHRRETLRLCRIQVACLHVSFWI